MSKVSDTEILVDPIVLALVWSKFASEDFCRKQKEEGDDLPNLDDDIYFFETSKAIFGENVRYPLNFFKGILLFTTRIRTPFSGKKFKTFKEMLYDQVAPEHHDQLSYIRPLFDDFSYQPFRYAKMFDERPWDFPVPLVGDWGQAIKRFFRFLNEDASLDFLIDEINELSWPDGEPIDFSMGLPQLLTDYLALNQCSFGLPYFSFKDASAWTIKPFTPQPPKTVDEVLQRNLKHALSITIPNLTLLNFDDLLELRKHRFFNCYQTIVRDGSLENLTAADLNEMLRKEIIQTTDEASYGVKETIIDLAKLLASFIPIIDKVVGLGDEVRSVRSRVRRYRNRWLWFVMNARQRSGDFFQSVAEP